MGTYVISMPALFPGDIAASTQTGKLYRVIRTKQVKAVCEDIKGGLWDVQMENLRDATDAEKELFESQNPKAEAEILRLGHVVRFKATSSSAAKFPGNYVVIKSKGNAVSLVKAGGHLGSQYLPTVLETQLEVVRGPVEITNV